MDGEISDGGKWMQKFRKYIRFWFGIKALGLLISIVSFLVAISKGRTEVNRAHLIATVLGALALDLSAGLAVTLSAREVTSFKTSGPLCRFF
jgi:hypothetical protein